MNITKTLTGGIKIEKNGFFINYFGYTQKDAIKDFRQKYKLNKI